MKIAVFGAGAVGGYFGALLAQAGNDVGFVCRGANLAAIRQSGIRLQGPRGDFTVKNVKATDTPREIGPVDVVLFCVKCHDTVPATAGAASLLRDGAMWLTLQNGVDSVQRLAAMLPREHLVPGAAFVSAVLTEPGIITYTSEMSSLAFGEVASVGPGRCDEFADACRNAGFRANVSNDLQALLWSKFVALATNAALTGLVRQPAGVVYKHPDLRAMAQQSIAEVITIASAEGIDLPADQAERSMALLDGFPPYMYASMYHDLAQGKPIEIAYLSGHVSVLGKRHGIPTPFHDFAYACLSPYENGPPLLS